MSAKAKGSTQRGPGFLLSLQLLVSLARSQALCSPGSLLTQQRPPLWAFGQPHHSQTLERECP